MMQSSLVWVWILVCTVQFSVILWLYLKTTRRSRLVRVAEYSQPSRKKTADHKVLLTRCNTLPAGYEHKLEAGLCPLSQVIATAFEAFTNPPGLYSVTFSQKTLESLRSGRAHLMHSVSGDRPMAVELNGKVAEIGTIAGTGINALRACFATASVITGQYFLARIDAKLNTIREGVRQIQEMLDSAERAALHLATSYLQFLVTAVRQGRRLDEDQADIRAHRTECLLIAERNLIALEDRATTPESREALGAKERLGELLNGAAKSIVGKASVLTPSAREDALLAETREFARNMIRGLVALEASLCCEAILEPTDAHSPAGMQVISVKQRFKVVREKFQAQFREKKGVALRDFRYLEAEEKRRRFEGELDSLLDHVERHWAVLEELETQWKKRGAGIPEVIYVDVNDEGQPLQLFLPEA